MSSENLMYVQVMNHIQRVVGLTIKQKQNRTWAYSVIRKTQLMVVFPNLQKKRDTTKYKAIKINKKTLIWYKH